MATPPVPPPVTAPPPPPLRARTRPPPKGVEFSDKLIVLGSDAASRTHSLPPPPPALPKARVFVRRGSVARKELLATAYSDHPDNPRSISSHFEHTIVSDDHPSVLQLSSEHPTRAYPLEDDVETSCTDSDTASHPEPPAAQHDFAHSTRINTKLNSLPSGGAFSFMNSSEDVHSRSIESESSSEDIRSTRRMVRVDGSAKLSTASGLADDDEDDDEDEFGIEGAERVDEEEALQVRSFGRSFARASLKHTANDDGAFGSSRHSCDHVDSIHVDDDDSCSEQSDCASEEDASTPPSRRKSRIRLTFSRRTTASTMRRSLDARPFRSNAAELSESANVAPGAALSCFPNRRTMVVKRAKTASPPGNVPGGGAMIAVPDFADASGRKMVKNVSMQRDDWIDFATNAASRQRHPWLVRLVSLHGSPGKSTSGSRDEDESSRKGRKKFWKRWGRK